MWFQMTRLGGVLPRSCLAGFVGCLLWARRPQMQMFPVVPAVLCVIEGQPPQSLSCTHHQAREGKLVATVLQHMGTHTLSFPVSHLQ